MQALTFIFAFVAVLALILLVAWLVRRFAGNRLGATANRGRMPRLAVIDAAAVDGRRRLVLVRRDNVEHLLMIGGPTDIVVESNIVRAASAREQIPQRPGLVAEPASPPRIAPLPDAQAWTDNETAKTDGLEPEPQITPMPELPTRAPRPAFGDDSRRSMSAIVERAERAERRGEVRGERREPMPFSPEPPGRPEPRQDARNELREPRVESRPDRLMPRGEPMREPILPRQLRPAEPPKPAEPFRPVTDRPMPELKSPPVRAPEAAAAPPPLPAAPPPLPPATPPQQSAEANLAEMAQRLEAALRRPPATDPQASAAPAASEPPRPAGRSEPSAATPKTSFENLEDEMASLLGRPKSSS
ncbi:MAG: flagellar biosynthetic protein FliO [Bradyrhizobium sp.]